MGERLRIPRASAAGHSLLSTKKITALGAGFSDCGEGGIRTLERSPFATLAVWCLQPLGHLSFPLLSRIFLL